MKNELISCVELSPPAHKENVGSQNSDAPFFEYDELALMRQLSQPDPSLLKSREVHLGTRDKQYTLFLDLDETLVCSRETCSQAGTRIRPFAAQLIQELSELYEIVIFTASERVYAQQVVDLLDPKGAFVKCVLSQEHCIPVLGGTCFVKDLRVVVDRRLDEMLIVDNSIISFAFQPENGIPVTPFFGFESEDQELGYLITYLRNLYEEQDIVRANRDRIGLAAEVRT